MMEVRNIHKRFDKQEVLKGIDMDVAKGEVVTLLGPSGSGKTTFLRCLNFLERADEGSILLGGTETIVKKANPKEILAHQRQTAMVFQNYALFHNKTARENIVMPLLLTKKRTKQEAYKTPLYRPGRNKLRSSYGEFCDSYIITDNHGRYCY